MINTIVHNLRNTNWLAIVFTIVVSINSIGFLPGISAIIPVSIALICVLKFILNGQLKIIRNYLLFLSFLPLTILLSNPDPVFQSWSRLLAYSAYFFVGSAMFENKYARDFRLDSLKAVCVFCLFIGIGSFIAYFLGYSAQAVIANEAGIDTEITDVGKFSGIAKQSMTLGPLAGIGTLAGIYLALTKRNKWYYSLALPCLGSVLFASSRAAFLATIAGCIIIFYKYAASKRLFVKYIVSICIVGAISFPLWNSALSGLQQKQLSHKDDKELFDSRAQKFSYRIKEFVESPLWGVGFSAINPKTGDKYDKTKGIIEPGSSWLAILSMTGAIGMILFLFLYSDSYLAIKRSICDISTLLMSVFVLLSVHMLAEGYIFAVGNPICYYVILVIGCGCDLKYNE